MNNKFLKTFFSSGLQAISIQVFGAAFFIVISFAFSTEDFGIISWVNTVSITLTTILSFGMEQIVIRRIAASDRSDWAAAAFLFHALVGSILTFAVLAMLSWFVPDETGRLQFLPIFFLAQSLIYIATPLKQFLNAKQRFAPYALIAVVSNIIKIILALVVISKGVLSIYIIAEILLFCAVLEFVSLLVFLFKRSDFSFRFKFVAYFKLLKESSPQFVAVLFDTSLSRIDWILLGLISTNAVTGLYALAYRAYEISRLPIVVIAPIILNIFSRMLVGGKRPEAEKQQAVRHVYIVMMFGAVLMPVLLNILWAPGLDYVYDDGKYGSSNATEFLLLSLCIPFQFTINLLWTLTFASKRYKNVTVIMIVSAITNLILNLILIPLYGGIGAAVAYLITNVIQLMGYYFVVHKRIMPFSLKPLVTYFILGIIVYTGSILITDNMWWQLLISVVAYLFVTFATKMLRKEHLMTIKLFLKK